MHILLEMQHFKSGNASPFSIFTSVYRELKIYLVTQFSVSQPHLGQNHRTLFGS